jgi:hypothetical protein
VFARIGRNLPLSAMPESVTVAASWPIIKASSYSRCDKFTGPIVTVET